jgi:hypothetical protein
MGEEKILSILLWGLGACVTGFLFLAGWMWWIVGQLHQRVPFSWLEDKFEKKIQKDMDEVVKVLGEIKDALVGDMHTPGLVSKVHDIEKDIKTIKLNCPKVPKESERCD